MWSTSFLPLNKLHKQEKKKKKLDREGLEEMQWSKGLKKRRSRVKVESRGGLMR